MSMETNPIPGAGEGRNAKGEWRPDYPCSYAPLFAWLPQPLNVLKWILGGAAFCGRRIFFILGWFC